MRPHDTLTRTVLDWCRRQEIDLAGKTVLAAVSGGRDSMALLHVLTCLSGELGFAVAAAHYNHQLRETAGRDEDFVTRQCAARGIPLFTGRGDVREYAARRGTSVEDAAREMRYAFLREAAGECGADFIATAHHRADNAETVLLHLLRGSGLKGLCGIPPVRGNIIRPLLDAGRADIERYLNENGIPYVEDETNADTVYTRNRIRLELLPLLEEIAPGSVGRIADAAVRLRTDEDFLEKESAALTPGQDETGCITLSAKLLRARHGAIASRIVRGAARKLGSVLSAEQTDAVLRLRSGGCLTLGGSLRAAREGDALQLYRVPDPPAPLPLSPGRQEWGSWIVTVSETEEDIRENRYTVTLCADAQDLVISAWDGTGRLAVESGRRTVKRLLSDHGIPAARHELCPAVFSGGRLAAVFGAGTDLPLKAQDRQKNIVITLERSVRTPDTK